jgi:predicted  nucleic acid-binding Zn-ribbon protein
MGLLSAVTSRLEPSREPQETFTYQCGRCETTFERPKSRMTRIRCPDCGASEVYTASEDSESDGTAEDDGRTVGESER